jgi:hypothetical protein
LEQLKTYLPLARSSDKGTVPWGYTADPVDKLLLHPDIKKLEALEKAFDYLDNGASLGKTAAWVEQQCGHSISTVALKKKYDSDPTREEGHKKRQKLIANYRDNNINRKGLHRDEEGVLKFQITHTRRKLNVKERNLKKLREARDDAVASIQLPQRPEESKPEPVLSAEVIPDVKKYITPNEGPQTEFLAAAEFEVLYGGAAGGGKSHAIVIDPLRTAHLKGHRPITFRRTNDELRELIWMSKEIYPNVIPGAKYSDQKSSWQFPNGGTHWFTYLDRDEDVLRYQGQAFSQVYWDEATQWPSPFPFDYMRSRIRSTDEAIRPYLGQRLTTNPGGPGHSWVKRLFIDPSPYGTAFPATDLEGKTLTYPEGHAKAGQPLFYRRFIQSFLKDNTHLYKDGSYETNLLSLPEVQRRQLLEGNWDVAEGAAFPEFNRHVHVCTPFEIPHNWTRFRACDWGYSSAACCLWFAEDAEKKIWVYRELYTTGVGPEEFASRVYAAEASEKVLYGVLDSSCFGGRSDGGPPIVSMMNNEVNLGWRPSDRSPGSRVARKQEVHSRLRVFGDGQNRTCGLTIFNNCVNLIRTLPVIPLDKNNPEDVNTDSEDHAYDALGYGCATRPYGRAKRTFFMPKTFVSPVESRGDPQFGY